MAGQRPGNGKPFAAGPYSHGGHTLVLARDGGIKVKAGDTVSGYAACLYRDSLMGWEEFGRYAVDVVEPLDDPTFILTGETVYHIPTWEAVVLPGLEAYKRHALALIDAFAARRGPQAFPLMDRAKVAEGLRKRVLKPELINQGGAYLCPSATVIYAEARDRPVHYVLFVIQLFEQGRSRIRNWKIEPSRQLRNYLPPIRSIEDADWIPMSSIRESEEWFWSNRDMFWNGGVANSEVIANWLRKAGYTDVRDNGSRGGTETERNLRLAGAYHDMGYRVFLVYDAMVLTAPANRTSQKLMHVATMTYPMMFFTNPDGSTAVDLTVQTWGSQSQIIPAGAPCMLLNDFLNYHYGFIAARF